MRETQAVSEEDQVFVARFHRGEEEAFDRLMARHIDKVFALAWGVLRNREDALDVSQEVFIKLHSFLPRLRPTDNISAWLYRVCLNQCIDRKRRDKRPRVEMTDEDWERLQGSEHDEPEFRAHQSETGRQIRQAVDALPERQRLVFTLRHYGLLSIDEIAAAIGCTSGAVKAHLSRATAHLRDWLAGTLVVTDGKADRDEV